MERPMTSQRKNMDRINIGLIGYGVVGQGVAQILKKNKAVKTAAAKSSFTAGFLKFKLIGFS